MKLAFCYDILAIVVLSFVNSGCIKSDSEPANTYRTLKVLEYKTNLPIAGVSVNIYECKRHSFGGCSELSSPATTATDNEGNFRFNSRLNVYFAEARRDGYWEGSTGGEDFWGSTLPVGDIYLTPIAYTKIHLKKINLHSADLSLVVDISNSSSSAFLYGGPRGVYGQPQDTTAVLPSYGYTNNFLRWHFFDTMGNIDTIDRGGTLPGYYINRFDTASVEINY